ncbi:MAG: hypothetical protein ACP5D2_04505, partial [Candidatus Nanoarchaeia archaeon]
IEQANRQIKQEQASLEKINNKIQELEAEQDKLEEQSRKLTADKIILEKADEKRSQIKNLTSHLTQQQSKLKETENKLEETNKAFEKIKNIEEEYEEARLRLQELELPIGDEETNLKQRDINRLQAELRKTERDLEESQSELEKINTTNKEKQDKLEEKQKQEQELYEKAEQFFTQKNELQDKQKTIETDILSIQHKKANEKEKINNQNIQKAQVNAKLEAIRTDFKEYESFQTYPESKEKIQEKLQKAQIRINNIGNVNLRALEIYEQVKEQCESIQKRVDTIQAEKEKIHTIIAQIDKKKKKTFIKTLDAVNEYFSRNFSQLSRKGEVFLDLENKKDPFEAGLNIILKVAKGKYFDITSLSGGEKTLVALSLIFAIQEYKPYPFYIFDEIDAALDKHNSERLAALVKKYNQAGQYIIISHNDAIISEASTLYGVSMQDNISNVFSMKI